MGAVQSNTDAILLAIPMLCVMFAVFFRLDEIFSRPAPSFEKGHPLSGVDRHGRLMCVEPDGRAEGRNDAAERRALKRPTRRVVY